jgi:hypothetical protein
VLPWFVDVALAPVTTLLLCHHGCVSSAGSTGHRSVGVPILFGIKRHIDHELDRETREIKRIEVHTFGLGRGGRSRHGSGNAVRGDGGAVSEARCGGASRHYNAPAIG